MQRSPKTCLSHMSSTYTIGVRFIVLLSPPVEKINPGAGLRFLEQAGAPYALITHQETCAVALLVLSCGADQGQ